MQVNKQKPGLTIVIDLNNNTIMEYYGYYIHERMVDFVENIDEAIDQIRKKIKIGADFITCRLIWIPDEMGWFGDREVITAPGYYELEYISGLRCKDIILPNEQNENLQTP